MAAVAQGAVEGKRVTGIHLETVSLTSGLSAKRMSHLDLHSLVPPSPKPSQTSNHPPGEVSGKQDIAVYTN